MANPQDFAPNRYHWLEFWQGSKRLGVGVLLTRCYALTTLHCLRGISADSDELEVSFAVGGEKIRGRVHRRSPEADLALIDIPKIDPVTLDVPNFDRARIDEEWHDSYRPSKDHAYLSGKVSEAAVAYQCEG